MFRTGVQVLRRITTPSEAAEDYSAIAEAVLQALLPHVIAEVARRHGPPPGEGVAILAMGKLGSGEMTARSDLDLIIVYDAPLDASSDGPRPLATPAWYARFAQTLVAALSAPTAQGLLYEVDMRLRPSGRQGPVAIALSRFARYQAEEAWTWEHLALTRARVVAGARPVCAALAQVITDVLGRPRGPEALTDVRSMRRRLAEAKGEGGPWELKDGAGRILDIELLLQTGRMLTPGVQAVSPTQMIAGLAGAGWLARDQADHLRSHLGQLMTVQQITRLALDGPYDPQKGGPGLAQFLAEAAGCSDIEALGARLAADSTKAAAIIETVLGDDA
ncbi:MAG: DUF294 nucleotidyltransferase-like domain-containing protein [Pseudomonadota bacterium]